MLPWGKKGWKIMERSGKSMAACTTKITIRECKERDLDAVYRIEHESFPDPFPPWYIRLLYGLSGKYFYVALMGKEITGYAAFIPLSNNTCHLASIAVTPKHRRKGIASCLLVFGEHACQANGYSQVYLEVEYTNVPAILLYKKHGYAAKTVILNYYGENRHAIVMVKKLAN